ncbi:YgaP family membrane protein [Gordonia insulae]|uniref:Uncharacterized protein n=1 Tax=Gordonia insulae TaxID=2420509 RepID=A0A3G8JI33_9ACTN|nr:DUF2892 domain-containing protein [Gordonia insulae]AZG44673.1 hypothetical protein D7316_01259 [Gordonia insulae]
MNRTVARLIRAVVAGFLIAIGVGLGAFNAWWVALAIGVPLIFTGMALIPRPSRISELDEFRRGSTSGAVPIEVEAITRSSLAAGELQPTMLTATLRPADDTAYRARWITSMSRGHFTSLVDRPFSTVPPEMLPPRADRDTPEFGDQPGRWALVYPATTLIAAVALLFGVSGSVWHIDASFPSVANNLGIGDESDPAAATADLTARIGDVLDEIAGLGPTASDNILSITLDEDDTSRAEVYDPATGQAISLWKYGGRGWEEPRRAETTKRRLDTFRAAEIAGTDVSTMGQTMQARLGTAGQGLVLTDMAVTRPVRGQPVLLVGGFGENGISDVEIQGRPDGTVAEFFDPGDFDTSFRLARSALDAANLSAARSNLRRFEIRGTKDNTPTMFAGQIQNSGGVLMEFTEPGRSGTLTVVPGAFPALSEYAGGSDGSFSFDAVSPDVFESVRTQAMARGSIEPFDRNAIDIQMTSIFQRDGRPVIQVELARESASAGTYSADGKFLKQGNF